MTDNFSFIQSLAKKYHKSSSKSKKITESSPLLDSFDQNTFKDDILNWLFSLPFKERMKAVSIENKWLASMVYQMYTKFKAENKTKFQLKNETYNEEEIFFSQYLGGINSGYVYSNNNEMAIENFFNIKTDHCK